MTTMMDMAVGSLDYLVQVQVLLVSVYSRLSTELDSPVCGGRAVWDSRTDETVLTSSTGSRAC